MILTDLSNVNAPVETANGLPNAHYVDKAVFEEETQALLASQWAGLAVAADVPHPGDAVPIEFLGMPLLLIRDKEGEVRVFHNICRHRGMMLVDTPRRIEGAIRCPYHSWCYSTQGKLVSTPHVGGPGQNTHPAIDRKELGLMQVRAHVWRDVVWVNLSGDAPDFETAMADIIHRWHEFDLPLYHGGHGSRFKLDIATNWKLAVENYSESYHLPWVHPGLNSYSRLEDHYHIEAPGEYGGQGSMVYRQLTNETGDKFPDFADVGASWHERAEYIAVYPNVLLGVHRDHAFAIILDPQGCERTIEHIHLYYSEPAADEGLKARNAQLWKTVFEEDISVVEGMQKGRHVAQFDGGRFSPVMDSPTHCFHAWVAGKVGAHRARQGAAAKAAE